MTLAISLVFAAIPLLPLFVELVVYVCVGVCVGAQISLLVLFYPFLVPCQRFVFAGRRASTSGFLWLGF